MAGAVSFTPLLPLKQRVICFSINHQVKKFHYNNKRGQPRNQGYPAKDAPLPQKMYVYVY